jgi:GTP-sensing pleiotropic transcriptional regulator CodY
VRQFQRERLIGLQSRKEVSEERSWRRDRALEAYVDVLKASATIQFESTAAYFAECNTEEQTRHVRSIFGAVGELHALGNRVLLLSPKEMFDDFTNLTGYLSTEIVGNSLKCPKISKTEWDRILGTDFIRVFSNFTVAARNDLGIHVPHLSPEELMRFNRQWKPETTK